MASIGLDGTYSRDVNGNPILTKFTDLDGSKFNYVNELVSMSFMQKDFNLNNYRTVGTNVANMVKYNDRLINTAFVNFEKQSSPTVELMPNIQKDKKLVFNQQGYDLFLASAAPVLAGFAKNPSVAYR
jgi:alpha-mannosidase